MPGLDARRVVDRVEATTITASRVVWCTQCSFSTLSLAATMHQTTPYRPLSACPHTSSIVVLHRPLREATTWNKALGVKNGVAEHDVGLARLIKSPKIRRHTDTDTDTEDEESMVVCNSGEMQR